jgi:tRNA threonylcarbamoyladenosine biosynthesis protein TsaE
MAPVLKARLADEGETLELGETLAPCLEPGITIYLRGELGAGKTTLVRGMLRALGHEGPVRSPTYALVEVYDVSRLHFHHFDFYRFHDPREWIDAGFRESFDGTNVTVVEWPEKAGTWLPPADVEIQFEFAEPGRELTLASNSLRGQKCLALLARACDASPASPAASS